MLEVADSQLTVPGEITEEGMVCWHVETLIYICFDRFLRMQSRRAMSAGVEAGKVAGVLEGRDAVIPKAKKALKKTKKQSKKVKKVSKHGKKTAKAKKMKKTGKAAQRAGAKPKGKPTKGSEAVVINLNLNSLNFFVWYHVLAQVVKEKRSEADARHEPGTAAQEAHVAEPGSTAALQASVQPSAQVRN